MARLLLCLLLFAPAMPVHAAAPMKVHASYDVRKFGLKGATMTETFIRADNHYSIESVTEAVGLVAAFKPEIIRVISQGTITAHGLRPDTFTITRKLDTHLNARADFDWAHQRITLTNSNGARTLPLKAGTQDRLSAMYQFMFLPLHELKELTFDMTNGNKLDVYNYILTPGRNVTIPLGTLEATYVVNPPEPGVNRTELWLATDDANLPCKMVITDPNGGQFSQVLTSIQIEP
jgi:hypothetical protein